MKLTLDELHLEIQVVENLPRNPRTLFPPRREDKDLPRSIMGYMKLPPLAKSKYSSSQATTTLFRSYSCLSSCKVGPLSRLLFRNEMAAEEIITDKTIGPALQNYANSRGWIDARANEIRRELKQVRKDIFNTYREQESPKGDF